MSCYAKAVTQAGLQLFELGNDLLKIVVSPAEGGKIRHLVNLQICTDDAFSGGKKLTADGWHILEFNWNCANRECLVRMDDHPVSVLPKLRESVGVCYLRLHSTPEKTDEAGFLIDFVECEVGN